MAQNAKVRQGHTSRSSVKVTNLLNQSSTRNFKMMLLLDVAVASTTPEAEKKTKEPTAPSSITI